MTSTTPPDCTCPPDLLGSGTHTVNADGVPTDSLIYLVGVETCPAERRALVRIIANRDCHLDIRAEK